MRQLNVKLSERQHQGLRRAAARRRTPVAWLIKDYIDSLVDDEAAQVQAHEATQAAARGGAFAWLETEPDLYGETDGQPLAALTRPRR